MHTVGSALKSSLKPKSKTCSPSSDSECSAGSPSDISAASSFLGWSRAGFAFLLFFGIICKANQISGTNLRFAHVNLRFVDNYAENAENNKPTRDINDSWIAALQAR